MKGYLGRRRHLNADEGSLINCERAGLDQKGPDVLRPGRVLGIVVVGASHRDGDRNQDPGDAEDHEKLAQAEARPTGLYRVRHVERGRYC